MNWWVPENAPCFSYREGVASSSPCEARPEKYICEQIPGGQKCSSLICWLEMPVSPSSQAGSTSQSCFSFPFVSSLLFEPTRVFKHTKLPTDHVHLEAWKQEGALKCVLISGDLINLLIAASALTAWACHFILLSTLSLLHLVAPKKGVVHPHFLLIKTTQKSVWFNYITLYFLEIQMLFCLTNGVNELYACNF